MLKTCGIERREPYYLATKKDLDENIIFSRRNHDFKIANLVFFDDFGVSMVLSCKASYARPYLIPVPSKRVRTEENTKDTLLWVREHGS